MEDRLSHGELLKLLATCWLDGAGEEWQRIAAEMFNQYLRLAKLQGVDVSDDQWKSARDMELYRSLNPDGGEQRVVMDWNAAEAMGRSLAGF